MSLKRFTLYSVRVISMTFVLLGMITTYFAFELAINWPKVYAVNGLPKFGNPSYGHKAPEIKILRGPPGGGCSAVVVDSNYAITAAHCVTNMIFPTLSGEIFDVQDTDGYITKNLVRAVGFNVANDTALLKGDFSEFRSAELEWSFFPPTNSKTFYKACGYPSLQRELVCNTFTPTHNQFFLLAGKGFLLPGMSGGPVYDLNTNKVIGVNSAAGNGIVLIAPTLGILATFKIEMEN